MSGFFKKKNVCPISEDDRKWMENSFLWLMTKFGLEKIRNLNILLPTFEQFPITLKSELDIRKVADIVANQMDIDCKCIELGFYSEGNAYFGGDLGHNLMPSFINGSSYSAGRYLGKNSHGKFIIQIELSQLNNIERLVATLAHEFSHIKILGYELLSFNDEQLTDLVTVFFGLGIFNANSAFRFFSSFNSWSYYSQGYLTQQEWGYALALFSYIRQDRDHSWGKYLTANIRSDLRESLNFIYSNEDKVLI